MTMKRIFLMLMALIAISASAENVSWLRYPSISPDGKSVAFSYKGDLYVVDSEGGEARQITSNPAYDYSPVWSPDGKTVVFASDRYGNFDIYKVSVDGGVPVRLTTHSAKETPWTFTPDGKNILFTACIQDPASSALFPKSSMTELYSVSIDGGRPVHPTRIWVILILAKNIFFVNPYSGNNGNFISYDYINPRAGKIKTEVAMDYSDLYVKRIRDLCQERGFSINKLATISNVKQSTLDNIVRGNTKNPGAKTLHRIALAFNMTLAEFLDFDDLNAYCFDDEEN